MRCVNHPVGFECRSKKIGMDLAESGFELLVWIVEMVVVLFKLLRRREADSQFPVFFFMKGSLEATLAALSSCCRSSSVKSRPASFKSTAFLQT
jgi:hypothetical protein